MTDVDKLVDGNDVTAVTSGALADAIIVWLDACASKGLEPRLSAKTGEVKLLAGPNSWAIACTPESMKAAMGAFKSDARFQRSGVKRNGFTSCMYLLSHPKDVPYVANGHTRTNGSAQTAGNTATVHLGSVAKAKAAYDKAKAKAEQAKAAWEKAEQDAEQAKAAISDAEQAEQLHKAEQAKAEQAKQAREVEQAKANKAALQAKLEKMKLEQAKLEKLLQAAEQAA